MSYTPFSAPANRPADIIPPAFAGVGGNYLSQEVFSQFDLYKPNEWVEVFERHGIRPGFKTKLKALGFANGTYAPTVGHYEYPWNKDLVRINAITTASAGAGATITLELTAASMFDPGVNVGATAQKASFVREGDILMGNDGRTRAIVTDKDTSVDPHRIDLTPLNAADDLVGLFVATEDYAIVTSAFGEGTGLPAGKVTRVMKYSNEFQIIKEAAGVTGSELSNRPYFNPVPGVEGSYYLKVASDAMQSMEEKCDGALVFGGTMDNVVVSNPTLGHDVAVKGTEGLIDFGLLNGYEDNYTVGSYALSDFDFVAGLYEQEKVNVRDICSWDGFSLYQEKENVLLTSMNSDLTGLLTQQMFRHAVDLGDEYQPTSDSDFALNIKFRAVSKGGYNFGWNLMYAFNEGIGLGSALYDYKNWSVMHPLGYIKDARTGDQKGAMGYEFKQIGNYSRELVIGEVAGVGAAGTGTPRPYVANEVDALKSGMVSELAFHGACANHLITQRP
jgi:hypothetical protein